MPRPVPRASGVGQREIIGDDPLLIEGKARGGTLSPQHIVSHGVVVGRDVEAVEGDRVVAVGRDVGPGKREIDATGQVVTPGWVDVHTHYDDQVTWDPHLTPSGPPRGRYGSSMA